ncbi:hypothetical protein [Halovivax sp.]|uniref:hypothetical protein n=1 Tax=Halovivax sp. TaxID=1935978 RepID=UPI0025BF0E48|nr:hypothetical protein [Halovivax sp.]
MSLALLATLPSFVGPLGFLLSALLVVVLVLVVGRLLFGLAWNVVLIVLVALGVLWLLGAAGSSPPPFR